jgi:hypothetical protein
LGPQSKLMGFANYPLSIVNYPLSIVIIFVPQKK